MEAKEINIIIHLLVEFIQIALTITLSKFSQYLFFCDSVDEIVFHQAFEPIAKVAEEIVKKNGFGDKISVIGKRSTELEMETLKGKICKGRCVQM